MDQRKTIPEIDRISEVSCLVEDVIGFIYSLRVGVRTPYHVPVLGKIFNFVENIIDWIDGVIMNFCHFFFKIVQINW